METKFNTIKTFSKLFMMSIFILASSKSVAQEIKSAELSDFKIIIEKNDSGINLKCQKGCAWKELTYSAENNNKPQAIDANGMTELNGSSENNESKKSTFLFTVEKIENGLKLIGMHGTAWTELSFWYPKNGKQAINQLGMISPN